jgi:glutathionyl-hydroquinone reductase
VGALIEGRWVDGELLRELSPSGAFRRPDSIFRDSVTADGSSGFSVKSAIFDRMPEADWAPFRNLAPDPWPKVQSLLKAA